MLHDLFEYNDWASRRILALLQALPDPAEKPLSLLAHLLTAEEIWLLRLHGQDTVGVDKSPKLTLAQCETLVNEHRLAFAEIIKQFESQGFASLITYRNLSGKEFTTVARDILTHVALHGTYHRGQIALALRTADIAPIDTDFITFVRSRDVN